MNHWTDKAARVYLERYGDHALNRLWLHHVDLDPSTFLLDIGCGGGAAMKAALQQQPDLRAVGVDPSPVMIRAARTLLPRADFYETGAESVPLPGQVISLALANCSIMHWEDFSAGLREVERVLRPQGQFLVIDEAFSAEELEGQIASPQELPTLLEHAGFRLLSHGHHDNEGQSYWATLAQKA